MKKLLSIFGFGLILTIGLSVTSAKAEEITELYPYDQQACLEATSDCTKTKLGDSHWDVTYNGANWNIPRAGVQYVSEFTDADNSGTIDGTEMTGTDWSSVGGLYINNTDTEVILDPSSANRQDLTGSWRGLWVYFDENGTMQMFESFVTFEFFIFNDGTTEAPDWRLATEAEIDAYNAAADEAKPETTKSALIRLKLDDNDSDGYVIEELSFLGWANKNVDTTTAPVSEWSTIVDGDPSNVVIPAGWTVMSFGTIERSSSPAIKAWGMTFPYAMTDSTTANMTYTYDDQPGWFNNLAGYDNDPATDGINIVVDFQSDFDLPSDITAEWVNMYDDSDVLINSTEKLDYSAVIKDIEGNTLETITYTYDSVGDTYTASAQQSVIDTSIFGSGFTVDYIVTTPEGDEHVTTVDVVVGVFPPTFSGVADRYINEMTPVDLMEGITADDGYGNDITSTIVLTKPDNLNVYNPMPGDYTIDLEFTHHVHFAGIAAEVTADGVAYAYDTLNSDQGYNGDHLAVYDDLTNFRNIETEYAMIYIVVGGDGTIVGIYDRYNWNWTTPDADNDGNPEVDSSTYNGDPLQWQADLTLEDGGFVLVVGRYNASKTALRALPIGTNVSFVLGTEDQDFDILVEESYVLTVDDITAPKAVVVDDNYEVEIGEYETVDAAILANVVGFDFYDDSEDLTIYVSNNGSLALDTEGTYTVEVTVEDQAGNTTVVEFDVTVVAPLDVQGLIDSQTVNSDDVQGMLDDQLMTDAQVQKLIDDTLAAETGCGGSIGAGSITLVALSVIGIAAFVIIRKK
jgi:hypothetical protein